MRRALRGVLQSIGSLPTQASGLILILIATTFGVALYRDWIDGHVEQALTIGFAVVVGYWSIVQLAQALANQLTSPGVARAEAKPVSARAAAAQEAGRLIATVGLDYGPVQPIHVDRFEPTRMVTGAQRIIERYSEGEPPGGDDLVYLISGHVAAALLTGETRALSASDRRAWEKVARLHAAGSSGHLWFEVAESEQEARSNARTLQRVWDEAWSRASALLTANGDLPERIVNALLSNPLETLSSEAINDFSAQVQNSLTALPRPRGAATDD